MASIQHYLLNGVRSILWKILGNCLSVQIFNLSDPQILWGGRLGPWIKQFLLLGKYSGLLQECRNHHGGNYSEWFDCVERVDD